MAKQYAEMTHDEYIKSMGLPPEDEQKLFEVFGKPENWNKGKGFVLRQNDYSRLMDEVKTRQAEVDAANTDVEIFRETLVEWQGKSTAQVEADEKRLAALEMELTRKEIALRTAAREAGVNDELLGTPIVTPPKPETSTTVDLSGYIKREDASKFLRESVMMNAQALNLMREHTRLFPDKDLDFAELTEEAIKHQMTPIQWWEKKYSVADAKRAQEETRIEARVKAAADEAYIRGRSESGKPSPRVQPSSALFSGDRTKRPSAPSTDYLQKAAADVYRRADYRTRQENDYEN